MLPKSSRLKGTKNFSKLYKQGSTLHTENLSVRVVQVVEPARPFTNNTAHDRNLSAKSPAGQTAPILKSVRVAVVTSKKVGKAHIRNKLRRRILRIVSQSNTFKDLGGNLMIAFITKATTAALDFAALQEEVETILTKLASARSM